MAKGDSEPLLDAPPAYDNAHASSSRVPPVEKKPRNQFQDFVGTTKEGIAQESVRTTFTGLIQDLVLNPEAIDSDSTARDGILESCNDICDAHSIPFSAILGKAFIQGHTPHYWAIVKHLTNQSAPPPPPSELPPLILDRDRPCDQWLFQGLRMTPEFNALSQTDRLLLGVGFPPDTVVFGPIERYEFEFPHFQQRSQSRLRFFVGSHKSNSQVGPGQWGAGLALLENSPAANIHATAGSPPTGLEERWNPNIGRHGGYEKFPLGPEDLKHNSITLPEVILYSRSPFLWYIARKAHYSDP
ncbi:hypothetical protein DFH07DRAFT_969174 [Mycena maculata]|uniref:Uncharacterized protein n=1 Tax=Mycena maculata TaxID=230809 RepID=A0AAD7HY72_9AGAR|nr:hypothetical protein DFH07DRAFT_969174 [Mycena maculata]